MALVQVWRLSAWCHLIISYQVSTVIATQNANRFLFKHKYFLEFTIDTARRNTLWNEFSLLTGRTPGLVKGEAFTWGNGFVFKYGTWRNVWRRRLKNFLATVSPWKTSSSFRVTAKQTAFTGGSHVRQRMQLQKTISPNQAVKNASPITDWKLNPSTKYCHSVSWFAKINRSHLELGLFSRYIVVLDKSLEQTGKVGVQCFRFKRCALNAIGPSILLLLPRTSALLRLEIFTVPLFLFGHTAETNREPKNTTLPTGLTYCDSWRCRQENPYRSQCKTKLDVVDIVSPSAYPHLLSSQSPRSQHRWRPPLQLSSSFL